MINRDVKAFISLGEDFMRNLIEGIFLKIYFSLLICVDSGVFCLSGCFQ